MTQQPLPGQNVQAICEALGFDPTNHHNAARCPYCTDSGKFRLVNRARVERAICDWFRDDAPLNMKMTFTPALLTKLTDRIMDT